MVVEVFHADLEAFERELKEKAAAAPAFFRNAPVLVDFEHLEEDIDLRWFNHAYDLLFTHSFIPVGVVAPPEYLQQAIAKQQIAVWPSGEAVRRTTRVASEQEALPVRQEAVAASPTEPLRDRADAATLAGGETAPQGKPTPSSVPQSRPTRLIQQPVRSGQKVYARDGDLIVMSSVSTGAEVMADGHVHIYGTLRGRAFAGAQGDENARIFCRDLQADLISVAGTYLINEDIPPNLRAASVQVYLRGEQLLIDPL